MKRVCSLIIAFALILAAFSGCKAEPLRVCIDVEYLKYFNDGSSDETLRRFLDHVEDLGGPENVVIDAVPSKGVERESALQRLRTEIMSGKGPDVFIVACPGGVFNNPSEALFTVPEKAMQNGLFLTLDDYIENAQYMDWNKLTSSVMNAGKNEYGQQILPLSYSVPVTCFVAAECESTDYSEACWQDMTDGSDDMLVVSATWFHSESAASEIMNGDYTEFTFGSLADYENEVLSFTENELYERTIEILELEEEYSNGEYADAPRHYQTLLYPGFNLRADNYGDGIDPFVGIESDESLKMVPIYCDEGGCVAEVQYFAAINSSTRYADEAFFILDVLFSLDSQQNSDMYEIFCEYGLPTYESLMQEDMPTKYSMRFALTDENYAEFNSLREQINCARFRNALTVEMHNTFTECREKYAVGDLAAVQQKIDDSYRTMEQILNE